jgi:hypothetical protein
MNHPSQIQEATHSPSIALCYNVFEKSPTYQFLSAIESKSPPICQTQFIEQVVASASLLTEDILKSETQRRYFIPSTSKRKERLLRPKVVVVEA